MFDVTLTFDNGPDPDATPAVLDTLARREVPASFFVLGHKLAAAGGRALAERAAAEGHWIANHTYWHETPLGRLDEPGRAADEIARTQGLIGDLAHPDKLFRPFGGGGEIGPHLLSPEALASLKADGFTCVLWNVIPRDWEDADGWLDRAMELIRPLPWSLVVLHDLPTGAMAHLDRFIETVREDGGRFRQDYPPDCVPLLRGQEVMPMAPYVALPADAAD